MSHEQARLALEPGGNQSSGGRPLRRVVLVGGPCSGKSTLLRRLSAELTDRVQGVPEAVTALILQTGLRPPFAEVEDQKTFVDAAYLTYRGFEIAAEVQARADGKAALLLDCCALVCLAYWPGPRAEFEARQGIDVSQCILRYDGVIFMEVASAEVFAAKQADNPARFHDRRESLVAEQRLLETWAGHPHLTRIPAYPDWEDKVAAARTAVRELLGV